MPRISAKHKLAIHEAGHAAASIYLRRAFKYATIVPKGDSAGHVRMVKLPNFEPDIDNTSMRMRRIIEREITINFAGLGAEYVVTGRKRWNVASHDTECAVMLALYLCGSSEETSAFLKWMLIRTCGLMNNPAMKASVRGLADALLERKTINAKECRRIHYESIQSAVSKSTRIEG